MKDVATHAREPTANNEKMPGLPRQTGDGTPLNQEIGVDRTM